MDTAEKARTILLEASAGLALDKPEYYERQEFVAIPLKHFERVCDLLSEPRTGDSDDKT